MSINKDRHFSMLTDLKQPNGHFSGLTRPGASEQTSPQLAGAVHISVVGCVAILES